MDKQTPPGPWKVFRNTKTMKLHVARDTEDGLEFLPTPSGCPREFRSGDSARRAIEKANKEQA